jgi:predicted O-methyltransferase YrrM
MSQRRWTKVDTYLNHLFAPSDTALEMTLRASKAAGLPAISVTANQGKLLNILARSQHAKKILEIGTLGGYSTIWLARALPSGGRLVTLEADPKHAKVAKANISRAGLAKKVELRLGKAQETLPRLVREKTGPFDLIFIDADKPGYPKYLEWSLKLSHPGTLIIADNVVQEGKVTDRSNREPSVQGIRKFNKLLATNPHLSATAIQMVGSKGWDGFSVALVTSN